jgi:hypothetical protein
MNRKPSATQSRKTVPWALMADNPEFSVPARRDGARVGDSVIIRRGRDAVSLCRRAEAAKDQGKRTQAQHPPQS